MRRATMWLSSVVIVLTFVTQTSAQSTTHPPGAVPSAPFEARAAPPPPEPKPAESPLQAIANLIKIYGIVRPVVTFSGSALESFSNPNASAPTAAANPVLANLADESRLTFQVAQSRFGLWVNEGGDVRGHLEFDFIDFAKSSPTVQALVRLRIAAVEWSPASTVTLSAGQDWDLPTPINPFGLNLVGGAFQAGNTGFMRQQIKALFKPADALEIGFAVGLQSANAGPKDAAVELARFPSLALRITALLGSAGRVGIGGIATQLRLNPGPMQERTFAGAGNVFGEITPTATTSIRFEGYIGSNLANIGVLALGQGRVGQDIPEVGGFLSVRQGFLSNHALYATFGHAHALHPSDVAPSYSYPDMDMAAVAAGTGPGIRWNQVLRVGYEWKPLKPLALALEGFWYRTSHALTADDRRRFDNTRGALGLDIGMLYTF
jgi:hypothetical protein